jgi:hypothetical protein
MRNYPDMSVRVGVFRIGVSPTRSWLSFPLIGGIRAGISVPVSRKRKPPRLPPALPVVPLASPGTGKMPGAHYDD